MASIKGTPERHSYKANEALTKYRFVNQLESDEDKVELIDAQSDDDYALGITATDAASGEHVDIFERDGDIVKLEIGEGIDNGVLIAPGTAGVGMIADSTNLPRARAQRTGASSGDVIPVKLIDQQVVA